MDHDGLGTLPLLETARLRLRMLRLDDAADQYAYACAPEVAEPGMWVPLTTLDENEQDPLSRWGGRHVARQPSGGSSTGRSRDSSGAAALCVCDLCITPQRWAMRWHDPTGDRDI